MVADTQLSGSCCCCGGKKHVCVLVLRFCCFERLRGVVGESVLAAASVCGWVLIPKHSLTHRVQLPPPLA